MSREFISTQVVTDVEVVEDTSTIRVEYRDEICPEQNMLIVFTIVKDLSEKLEKDISEVCEIFEILDSSDQIKKQ